jgi:hypothetical protein
VLASVTDVERILTALGARQDLTDGLMSLARLANTDFENVRSSLKRGLHQKQRELAALEADATHIRFFLPTMLSGLLQTPEYARASLGVFPGDHSQAVAKRLDRQATLYNRAKRFTFILTEAAVRWQLVEAAVMAVQLGRLSSLSELPNIRLGIIPLDTHVPDGPLNTFTVYDDRIATAGMWRITLSYLPFLNAMPSLMTRCASSWSNAPRISARLLCDQPYSISGII